MSHIGNAVDFLEERIGLASACLNMIQPTAAHCIMRELADTKEEAFEEMEDIIKRRLHDVLKSYDPELINTGGYRTWDEYIYSLKERTKNLVRPCMEELFRLGQNFLERDQRGQLLREEKRMLRKTLTSSMEEMLVRGGINTSFSFIHGLLRVTPMLWFKKFGEKISKTELLEVFNQKRTKNLLNLIAKIHTQAMNSLLDLFWRGEIPEDQRDDLIRGVLGKQDNVQIGGRNLFADNNFKLADDKSLALSKHGGALVKRTNELTDEALKDQDPDKIAPTVGCPALRVEVKDPETGELEPAIEAVCKHLTKVIQMIPDEEFDSLIDSNFASPDQVANAIQTETIELALKQVARTSMPQGH